MKRQEEKFSEILKKNKKNEFTDNEEIDDIIENFSFGIPGTPDTVAKACLYELKTKCSYWPGTYVVKECKTTSHEHSCSETRTPGIPGVTINFPDVPSMDSIFDNIKDSINRDLIVPIQNTFNKIHNKAKKGIQDLIDNIKREFQETIDKIKTAFTDAIKKINDWLQSLSTMFDNIKQSILEIIDSITNKFKSAIQEITGGFNVVIQKINEAFNNLNKIFDTIKQSILEIIDNITNKFRVAIKEISDGFNVVIQKINEWFKIIGDQMNVIFGKMTDFFNKMAQSFTQMGKGLSDIFTGLFVDGPQGLGEGLSKGFTDIGVLLFWASEYIFSNMKCGVHFIQNLNICISYYILDTIRFILYSPVTFVKWLVWEVGGRDLTDFEDQIWSYIYYLDVTTGIHAFKYTKAINNRCYNCKRLKVLALKNKSNQINYDFMYNLPPLLNKGADKMKKGGDEFLAAF